MWLSEANVVLDPVPEVGHIGVHTRKSCLCAAPSPGHDTSEASADGHGATGVTTAGILATHAEIASTDLTGGKDGCIVVAVGFEAEIGAHQRHGHAPKLLWIVLDAGVTPAGDDSPGAGVGLVSGLE